MLSQNMTFLRFEVILLVSCFLLNVVDARISIADKSTCLEDDIPELLPDCSFALNLDLPEPQPLYIVPGTEKFVEPHPDGIIRIPSGAVIELFCTNSFATLYQSSKIYATCLTENVFSVEGKEFYIHDFVCNSQAFHIARRTDNKCYNGASLVKVGFDVEDRFLQLLEVCHDEITESTLYVHHKLTPSSNAFQISVPRVTFIPGDFYDGKNVNKLYKKKEQMNTIGGILGGVHEQYFNDSMSFFLARGHLAAKADLIFGAHQRATFYFINAAPQWQRFNGGNWERVESGVRSYVANRNIEVDCYTGTWGIMELPDIYGNRQQLFLAFDNNNNGLIPVPKLYYRVIVESATNSGIVLIGVNNPHLTLQEILDEYVICSDISDGINWIPWKKDDISSGYSYACEVNEFASVVGHLPDLHVTGILW